MHDEAGFTFVELLVVILIFALLAAVAIPAFFSQRSKADDADAKVLVRTAQTAIATYASDHGGDYAGATTDKLQEIEGVLNGVPDSQLTVKPAGSSGRYEIGVESATGNVFSVIRAGDGTTSYSCSEEETSGCPSGGDWSG